MDESKLCICIGQKFLCTANVEPLKAALKKRCFCSYSVFILALVNSRTNEVNLIDETWGNPWSKPIKVKNPHAITDKEFISLVGEGKEFIRIV